VKVWYHVIAAVVGLATAALIVYIVFGNASQQGATQDGAAPGSLDAGGALLCGTITPAEGTSAKARATARDSLPSMSNAEGPIAAISKDHPDQQDWFERVHAAAGLCTDEIRLVTGNTTIALSDVEGVTEAEMSAYTAGALAQAFTAPFDPLGCTACHVSITASVGGTDRTAVVSTRAWQAFQFARKARRQPLTMHALAQFQAVSGYRPADLRVKGW
jgi:hypothetical protein